MPWHVDIARRESHGRRTFIASLICGRQGPSSHDVGGHQRREPASGDNESVNISRHAIPTIGCSGMTVRIEIPDKAVLSTLKPGR